MSDINKTRNHSFNIDLACKYGSEKAVIIQNIIFWIIKNKADRNMGKHGFYWTFASSASLGEMFPYFKPQKIARMLRQLESEDKVLASITGSKNKWNKTKWYTIIDPYIIENFLPECLDLTPRLLKNEQSMVEKLTMDDSIFNALIKIYNSNSKNLNTSIAKKEVKTEGIFGNSEKFDLANELLNKWNNLCKEKPLLRTRTRITSEVRKKIKTRIKEHPSINDWDILFNAISESKALGVNPELSWFSFSFLFQNAEVFEKIIDGKYEFLKVQKKEGFTPTSPRLEKMKRISAARMKKQEEE